MFDQINAELVSIRDLFQKHLKKKNYQPQTLWTVYENKSR